MELVFVKPTATHFMAFVSSLFTLLIDFLNSSLGSQYIQNVHTGKSNIPDFAANTSSLY